MNIVEYLSSLPAEKYHYLPNKGNAGDSLISYAAYQLFNESNLNYEKVKLEGKWSYKVAESLEGKNIIFDGGGSIIDLYKRDANYLEKYHREAKKVVILPQTINGNEQLLASLDSNVDILCRELTSFEYVKSVVTKANVFLMDDMAFSIDVDKTLAAKSLYSNTEYFFSRLPKQRFYLLLNYLKRAKNGSLKTKVLNSFRKDIESTSIEIPEDNIDVSYIFAFYDFSEGAVQEVVQRMLRFLNNFEIVNTNRLHICIASALLGKK